MRRDLDAGRVVALVAALTACTTGGGGSVECGPDTEARDGACVSVMPEVTCAEGSTRDPSSGQCVSNIQCAPGTTYDPGTGTCRDNTRCGTGTVFNATTGTCDPASRCGPETTYDVATRTCLPTVSCGGSTVLVDGACIPEDRCGAGTFHINGVCVPEVQCGRGLVAHQGVCRTPGEIVAQMADAVEPATGQDDPAFGGTPMAVGLEGHGEAAVFVGVIARPVDFDSDGRLDQDVDAWSFTAAAGTYVRLRIIDDGAPQPIFTVTGPRGYIRHSAAGGSLSADRDLVLPYAGSYVIKVVPAAARLPGAAPVGSASARYVGILEQQVIPATIPVSPTLSPAYDVYQADVVPALNRFLRVSVPVGSAFSMAAASVGATHAQPELLVFDAALSLRSVVSFTYASSTDRYTGHGAGFARDEQPLLVVLDWVEGDGGGGTQLAVELSRLRHVDLGTLVPDSALHQPGGPLVIPANQGVTVGFDVEAQQVVTVAVTGLSSPALALLGADGATITRTTATALAADGLSAWARDARRFIAVVQTTGTSDLPVTVAVMSQSTVDAGTHDGSAGAPFTTGGATLGPGKLFGQRAWVKVENSAAALFRIGMDALVQESGDRWEGRVYGVEEDGALTNLEAELLYGDLGERLVMRDAPGTMLVVARIASDQGRAPDPTALAWSVSVQPLAFPTLMEREPNDSASTAQALGDTPVTLLASLPSGDDDTFTFSLAEPLAAGQAVFVTAARQGSPSTLTLHLQDELGTPLRDMGNGSTASMFVTPADGDGPFRLVVEGGSMTGPDDYVLELRVVSAGVESEPNDATAQVLGTVSRTPLEVTGLARVTRTGTTYERNPDLFRITVPSLFAGTALLVEAFRLDDAFDMTVELLPAGSTTPITRCKDPACALLYTVPPGAYDVRIVNEETFTTAGTREKPYRLRARLLDAADAEPNDDAATANGLGTFAAGTRVETLGMEGLGADWYRVDLSTALGADEVVEVSWATAMDRGDIFTDVRDAAGVSLASSETPWGRVVVGRPGLQGPLFVVVNPARSSGLADLPELYTLAVERRAGRAEVEPNDAPADAVLITTLPARIEGLSRGATTSQPLDADIYRVILPRALASTECVAVQALTTLWLENVTLDLLDASGAVVDSLTMPDPAGCIRPRDTAAGTAVLFQVTASANGLGERTAYSIDVDIVEGDANLTAPP